jgi:hypothetical protein
MTKNFVVDVGISKPRRSRASKLTAQLAILAPEESFFIPDDGTNNISVMRSNISIWGKRHKKRFSTRTVDGGWRVWREE